MRRPHLPSRRLESGYTLVELMVTLVLTLLLLAASLAFYMMSRTSYASIDDSGNLQERGNFAMSVVTRLLQQTAFTPQSNDDKGGLMTVSDPMILGRDACSAPRVATDADGVESFGCGPGAAVNNSDAVMIRFFGFSGADGKTPDGSVVDCSGQAAAGYTDSDQAARQRSVSVLYVARGTNGKPSLWCQYRQRKADGTEDLANYTAQELVPGVEAFQVLYGVGINDDEVPDKYVTASQIATVADWKTVLTVKVSMVVRTDTGNTDPGSQGTFSMFGPLGASLQDSSFQPTEDLRSARKLFSATIQLRNYLSCLKADPTCM